jgi:hypothetical protein
MATRWQATKSAMVKMERGDGNSDKGGGEAMKRTTVRAGRANEDGDKEGNGKGSKSNGNGDEGGG